MCGFGLSISVDNLAGDPFLNFALLGTADCAAKVCFFIFMRFFPNQRKRLTVVSFFGLGVTCLTISLLLKLTTHLTIIVPLFIIGKFLSSINNTTAYLLMVESFPADCRLLGKTFAKSIIKNFAGGMLCQVISRGSVLGIVFLVQTSTADFKWIVPAIFGIMGLVSSILVHYLPDRSTSPLLNTMANIKRLQITTVEKSFEKFSTENKTSSR